MATRSRHRIGPSRSTAVLVRSIAFIVATIGILMIPASVVATTSGHVTHQAAFAAVGVAVALIVAAALVVRPFDPFRD